ncbi:hypothetical protein JDV02_010247 [Purpureocillium takamizusanense]|uniref:Uncharacterized protein n=1 Tax=Purpureocillium takamizusanense TaxID=2060973 RepID=A0A9Q8QSB9_9HYPO|nr:uncharacterized protein JDV02_010247 [Purpureocillium takamizusanense]UNI24507.1 hypothetical protein JDV02_010247 [Purpureocillium takamizusanense]
MRLRDLQLWNASSLPVSRTSAVVHCLAVPPPTAVRPRNTLEPGSKVLGRIRAFLVPSAQAALCQRDPAGKQGKMAEVVGVVSAAVQLGQLCLSISSHIHGLKKSTKTLENYNRELTEVSQLSDLITKNPSLQTPEVERYTKTLLELIQQTGLATILGKQWLTRAFFLLHKQQDLNNAISAVERQKTSLLLYMDDVTLQKVQQINVNINRLIGTPERDQENTMSGTRTQIITNETGRDRILEAFPPRGQSENSTVMAHSAPSDAYRGEGRRLSVPNVDSNGVLLQINGARDSAALRRGSRANHVGNYAGPNVNQWNGARVEGAAAILPGLKDTTEHRDAKKEGPGEQRNGSTFYVEGDLVATLDIASLSGYHTNASATTVPSVNSGSNASFSSEGDVQETCQINGPSVYFRKST